MDDALAWLETRAAAALLRLGPPLRPAHALRPARAVRLALPEPAVPRRDRLHATRSSGGCSSWLREQGLSSAPSSSSPPTTARASATTASRRTPTSSTTPPRTCRSWSGRPGESRGRRSAQVSSVDLMPTVLDLARPAAAARDRRPLARARAPRPRRDARPHRVLGDLLPALPLRLAAPARDPQPSATSTSTPPSPSSTTSRRTRARRRTSTAAFSPARRGPAPAARRS